MKYFYKDTYSNKRKKEISRNEALSILTGNYTYTENMLKIAEKESKKNIKIIIKSGYILVSS